MTPEEWDELAEQVLTRGVQDEAEQILTQPAVSVDDFPPPAFSDESGVGQERRADNGEAKR